MYPHLLGNILRISRCASNYRSSMLQVEGLRPMMYAYINYICKNPGSTQEQITKHLCVDKTTVARQLVSLEQAGYVRREVSQKDARCRLIYPTREAEELLPKIRETYRDFLEATTDNLTEEEKKLLNDLLEKMCSNSVDLIHAMDDPQFLAKLRAESGKGERS